MKIEICESLLRPREVAVASSTGDGTAWMVTTRTLFNDSLCDCPGFQYRGECRHTKELDEGACTWFRGLEGKHQIRKCPGCHVHPTKVYELEPEYDEIKHYIEAVNDPRRTSSTAS